MSKKYETWEFALFSAHIHYYLPAIAWQDHYELYEKWKSYHSARPFRSEQSWNCSNIEVLKAGQPKIISLYHLGFHAQIPRVMADSGIHFDILMDRSVYQSQQEEFVQMQQEMQRNGLDYRYLMSDDVQVLLKIRTSTQSGKHVLVFVDGNSGVSDIQEKKVAVNFLENTIYVRTGIPLISYLLHVPIVPLAHFSLKGRNHLMLGNEINRDLGEDRNSFIYRSMQELYDFLAKTVQNEPWKWECWSYLHELNCYNAQMPSKDDSGQENNNEALINLRLKGRKGSFDRKHFCYKWE
ncbi:hypothetical protein [Sphingobacterium detergens]